MAEDGTRTRQSDALVSGGIPLGEEDTPKPIGVPEDYEVPERRPPSAIWGNRLAVPAQKPRYFTGDEWTPASMSPEDRARLQRLMEAAGVFAPGTRFRLGVWDDASRTAYSDLLAFANGAGLSVEQAMQQWSQSVESKTVVAGERTLPASTMDVRAMAQEVAQRRWKRKMTPTELEDFEASFRLFESRDQENPYEDPNAFGGQQAMPDPSVWAAQQVETMNPEEAVAGEGLDMAGNFIDMLRGPV